MPLKTQIGKKIYETFKIVLDTMDKWDEDKLKQVVEKKHGDVNKQKSKTDIVSTCFVHVLPCSMAIL